MAKDKVFGFMHTWRKVFFSAQEAKSLLLKDCTESGAEFEHHKIRTHTPINACAMTTAYKDSIK